MSSSRPPTRWVVSGHSCESVGWETDCLEEDEEAQGSSCVHAALANNVGLLLSHVSTIFQKPIIIVILRSARHAKILFVETSLSNTSPNLKSLKIQCFTRIFVSPASHLPVGFFTIVSLYTLKGANSIFCSLLTQNTFNILPWLFFKANKNKHVCKNSSATLCNIYPDLVAKEDITKLEKIINYYCSSTEYSLFLSGKFRVGIYFPITSKHKKHFLS